MLTEKAESERKWGWLPALRLILEPKRVPDHYFGPTSVSDNIFHRVHRLIEIGILVHENRSQIIEKMNGESKREIMNDLFELREAFSWAKREFQAAEDSIETLTKSK